MPATDERFTPPEVIAVRDDCWVSTTTDPCWHPRSYSTAVVTYTKEDDGLELPWFGRVWLNPPWSNVTPWIEKLIAFMRAAWVEGGLYPKPEGMLMVKNDPSTAWWKLAWWAADAIILLAERTRYHQLDGDEVVPCGTPEFSSVIFYFGDDAEHVVARFEAAGHYGRTLPHHEQRMAKTTKTMEQRIDDVVRTEIVTFARDHASLTYHALRKATLERASAEDRARVQRVFDSLPMGAFMRGTGSGSSERPVIATTATDKGGKSRAKKTSKKTASKVGKKASKKAGNKAPKKSRDAKPPAPKKAAQKRRSSSQDASERARQTIVAAVNDASQQAETAVDRRMRAILQWLRDEGMTEVKAADVMERFGVSRQTATRTLQRIDSVVKVGDGAGTKYIVTHEASTESNPANATEAS